VAKISTLLFVGNAIQRTVYRVVNHRNLFGVSLLENVIYGKQDPPDGDNQELVAELLHGLANNEPLSPFASKTITELMSAITDANAHDFVKDTHELATKVLGLGGTGLSGGQKQRVTIARALYKDPKILLLDEATSALDQISEAVIQKALDNLTQRRTVLVVAHRLNTIKNADKILVMDKGRIIEHGTHKELMKTSVKYKSMVEATKKRTRSKETQVIQLLKDLSADLESQKNPDKDLEELSVFLKNVFTETQ